MSTSMLIGDCRDILKTLPDCSVHCAVTSPPYFGLRNYGCVGQIGLEATPDGYVAKLVKVFRELRRVLRSDGTLWLNLGDTYNNRAKVRTSSHQPSLNNFEDDQWADRAARGGVRMSRSMGHKEKDRMMIPARVALALQADGWWLRDEIIWHKPNPMPSSVTDRTTPSHEMLYMFSKSKRYYYDMASIREPSVSTHPSGNGYRRPEQVVRGGRGSTKPWQITDTRQPRSVWTINTKPFKGAHFATFPPALIEPCILAGCPVGGTVIDPFGGAGTTAVVADQHGRNAILIELNPEYAAMTERRLAAKMPQRRQSKRAAPRATAEQPDLF